VIKAHGSSDERAIKNAIASAVRFVAEDVNGFIQDALQKNQSGESE
jgi:glycerol-3-phosphate acyltransferase PlsX